MPMDCKKCAGCGVTPHPVKLEMNEIYECRCDCGLTCLGSNPDEATDCWNHLQGCDCDTCVLNLGFSEENPSCPNPDGLMAAVEGSEISGCIYYTPTPDADTTGYDVRNGGIRMRCKSCVWFISTKQRCKIMMAPISCIANIKECLRYISLEDAKGIVPTYGQMGDGKIIFERYCNLAECKEGERVTNPCEIGLDCPYMKYDEDDDLICVHPCDDETIGLIEEVDCPLVDYPSVLYDLITMYHSFIRGSSPSIDQQMSSAMRHTKGSMQDCPNVDPTEKILKAMREYAEEYKPTQDNPNVNPTSNEGRLLKAMREYAEEYKLKEESHGNRFYDRSDDLCDCLRSRIHRGPRSEPRIAISCDPRMGERAQYHDIARVPGQSHRNERRPFGVGCGIRILQQKSADYADACPRCG